MMPNPFDCGYYETTELREFGFKNVGENVHISRDCTIIGLENIALADHVRIDSGTSIVATYGMLTLEGWNHIGGQNHFCVTADLTIGEFSGTSQGVRIYTATDDTSGRLMMGPMAPAELRGGRIRPIHIREHVSIGSGSVLLPGCDVHEGSVVGALSLVNRPLRPWGIYHGNPVRRINERSRDVVELGHVAKARPR